jgi:hypothetical protein
VIVVSTSYAPPVEARGKCIASVPREVAALPLSSDHAWGVEHFYVDAAEQHPPLSHFENLIAGATLATDDEIIVSLDGDDWLLPGALERVQREHDAGALVTYGSFVFADGRPGFAAPANPATIRRDPWTATHLKTFRAGLLRRIRREHLQDAAGRLLEHARDLALMFPLIEMAAERAHFIPDVLCVYNYVNSTEFRGDAAMLAAERAAVAYVRGLPAYERLP